MPFLSRVSWRLGRATTVAVVTAIALFPATAALAVDGRSATIPIEVDLVGEAIAGMSTFVAAGLDTDDAYVDGNSAMVTFDECPVLSHEDLAGLVEEPSEPDDFRRFAAFSTSTPTDGGEFVTLACQSGIVRRGGNQSLDSATLTVNLYPASPSLDELITTSARRRKVERDDGVDTVGFCEGPSDWGHACEQLWQSGRLVVTLSRTSHEADAAFDAISTGETLMSLVPTLLYDLASLDATSPAPPL